MKLSYRSETMLSVCQSSCLFYLRFNFDFYVSKIMRLSPSNFIAGRPKAALLFCLPIVFFQARFIAAVSIVSISLVCDSSIVATCPSIPAARFAFCLCFVHFVFVVRSCFAGEPKQNQGRE